MTSHRSRVIHGASAPRTRLPISGYEMRPRGKAAGCLWDPLRYSVLMLSWARSAASCCDPLDSICLPLESRKAKCWAATAKLPTDPTETVRCCHALWLWIKAINTQMVALVYKNDFFLSVLSKIMRNKFRPTVAHVTRNPKIKGLQTQFFLQIALLITNTTNHQ